MQTLSQQAKSFEFSLTFDQELPGHYRFDILLGSCMDLLSDPSYEALLKRCASGAVAYGAASPSCAQYSRLKLRGGSGPPPLRTPEFLQGVPGLQASDLAKVQESFTMLDRCVKCLTLIHSSGGHVHQVYRYSLYQLSGVSMGSRLA